MKISYIVKNRIAHKKTASVNDYLTILKKCQLYKDILVTENKDMSYHN